MKFAVASLAFVFAFAYMMVTMFKAVKNALNIRVTRGAVTFPNGAVYTGQWLNGKPDGHGKLVEPNGETYEGQFVDGYVQGFGKFNFADGAIYEGEWL